MQRCVKGMVLKMVIKPLFQKSKPLEVREAGEPYPIENPVNRVVEIPVAAIRPNPSQPRVIFDDYELSQLAVSIRQNGMLQPVTVRRVDDGMGYEIVSGERRLRASKLISLEHIPCIVIDTDNENSAILAILENIQRADLNYIEEAIAIKSLIDHFGITQEDCASRLGIAQSTVANKLRLLRLSDEEKALALRFRLNERQARALLKLPHEKRLGAIEKIGSLQLNTQQTDKFICDMLGEKPVERKKHVWAFKQVGLYINTFNKTIESMKNAGIDCVATRNRTDDFVEYIVKIPLK
ncbi:MAG: ParB/RepB/Spo0J family partition protein [Oscillospiraceae bacterium]|nr:ParB/RepB/Spo0J family partition protein [Oscillospiraceae bacterium]